MPHELVEKKNNEALNQFIRYVLTAIIASSLDFACLFILTEQFHIYYLASAVPAFLVGLVTSYILNITWVFENRRFNDWWFEFGIFTTIGVVGLFLNEVLIWVFTEHAHFHYLVSKVLSVIAVFFWNFIARKSALFH